MVNHILIDGHVYMIEQKWRNIKKKLKMDSNGKPFPYQREGKEWAGRNIFVDRLKAIEKILYAKNSYKTIENKKCLICGMLDISTIMFIHNRIVWESGLVHNIAEHMIEPSDAFKEMVYLYHLPQKKSSMSSVSITGNYYGEFVKIDKRQLNILDALMIHGGYNKNYTTKDEAKYSEHAGALDFEGALLTRIIVSGNTTSIDEYDNDIYFPIDMSDIKEYEYIFHSHPPTPRPGGRASEGVLYEVPSIGDIFHFIEHHNTGNIIGSLVVTAEGLYCIRNLDINSINISINDNALFKAYNTTFNTIQDMSIKKYGTTFSARKFYTKIAQDTQWIDQLNKTLNKFKIHIEYYPRKKDINNVWILDTVFLPFRKNNNKKRNNKKK